MDEAPPDAAYGRVTNPGRYEVLHAVARDLVGWLERTYEVQVREDTDTRELLGITAPVRIWNLEPSAADAAGLTIVLSDFPGVVVRIGRGHVEAFPSCGCDACDENPAELVDELRQLVEWLVDGQIREYLDKSWLGFEAGPSRSRRQRLSRQERERYGRDFDQQWQPWSRR